MKLCTIYTTLTTLFLVKTDTHAFSSHNGKNILNSPPSRAFVTTTTQSQLSLTPNGILSSILLSDENVEAVVTAAASSGDPEWKQYVPLAASGFVILDILLGSPFLNIITAPMKRAAEESQNPSNSKSTPPPSSSGGGLMSLFSSPSPTEEQIKRERVDSEAIAQAALDKARNSLELRNYLEANKSTEQRYEEIRKQIDNQFDEFDTGRFGPDGKGVEP
uniref:Uncharacterized protein n=1 Tax=Ditylum brightwellii TaxID=49249 RepID=A0A7S4QDS1_9STRA